MLRRLAGESGIRTPIVEELARPDRARNHKTLSIGDWTTPTIPRCRIARMKDGTMHPA